MVRTGSIQKVAYEHMPGLDGRVGKVLRIVTRGNHELCVFKLHYNGERYVVPSEFLVTPTTEEKKLDKKNSTYWRDEHQSVSYHVCDTTRPLPVR
jgi:hypothetical protein